MAVNCILFFDAPLDHEELETLVEERFLNFGRFKQKPIASRFTPSKWRWQDDDAFSIHNHVKYHSLPAGDQKDQLELLISHLVSTPLNRKHPLWQLDVIEDVGAGCAIAVRIHHSIADGLSLIFVLLSILDSDGGLQLPTSSGSKGLVNRIKTFFGRMAILAKAPFTFFSILRKPPDPVTVLRGDLSLKKVATWLPPIPLQTIKDIGESVDATINDVLVTILAGALRTYLIEHGEDVSETEIHAVIPVGMRPLHKASNLGNVIGAVNLGLPIHLDDPIARLKATKRRMDRLKRSPEAWISYQSSRIIGRLPRNTAKNIIVNARKKSTLLVSNVPGPRKPLKLAGEEVTRMMFWGPLTGRLALSVSILSYNGMVSVGAISDANVIPDPERLLIDFEEEFGRFKRLV